MEICQRYLLREELIGILGVTERQFQRYVNGGNGLKGLIAICPEYFEPRMVDFSPEAVQAIKTYQAWMKKKRGKVLEKIAMERGFPHG